jgi:hypothetical protein
VDGTSKKKNSSLFTIVIVSHAARRRTASGIHNISCAFVYAHQPLKLLLVLPKFFSGLLFFSLLLCKLNKGVKPWFNSQGTAQQMADFFLNKKKNKGYFHSVSLSRVIFSFCFTRPPR